MTLVLEHPLTDLAGLEVRAEKSEVVRWQERETLRLENGLLLVPDLRVADAGIEVWIGTEGPAYPGIAWRAADALNYELSYAVPHVSGRWDALQYDPVFHGSNTWQLYHGPAYQGAVEVPTGRWFHLRVDTCGQRAAISVDGQPALVVERLAHGEREGMIGLWTFLPAHFSGLRVWSCGAWDVPPGVRPSAPASAVCSWFVEGYGVLACEPNGVLNLNRHLPASLGQVRLLRRFELAAAAPVALEFGFSDVLALELDGEVVFEGECTFQGFANRESRGYPELGQGALQRDLAAGQHSLAAALQVSEGFGWGMILTARAEGLRWLPAELG